MSAIAPLAPVVQARLDEVSGSLHAATGGGALCRIDGTGGSAKSLEGRMAALLEARRLLRRDPQADLRPLLDAWRASRDAHLARGASPAWREYDNGGVAELERLLTHPPDSSGIHEEAS
ncbi:MAG: hypothetical protein MUF35_08890 [Candidatus Nanopelagicales bacterium]|jgi:hypothetical protein|nr:hypothetical protein [Candidatus Nanopelagicales bacterium]